MRKGSTVPTMKLHWRPAALVIFTLSLLGCASQPQRPEGQVEIGTTSQGKPLTGVDCTVRTLSGSWNVQTPGTIHVGSPNGDLQVVCNHPGYRTSEVIIRAPAAAGASGTRVSIGVGGGFGGYSGGGMAVGIGFPVVPSRPSYPASVVVDLTPQSPNQ